MSSVGTIQLDLKVNSSGALQAIKDIGRELDNNIDKAKDFMKVFDGFKNLNCFQSMSSDLDSMNSKVNGLSNVLKGISQSVGLDNLLADMTKANQQAQSLNDTMNNIRNSSEGILTGFVGDLNVANGTADKLSTSMQKVHKNTQNSSTQANKLSQNIKKTETSSTRLPSLFNRIKTAITSSRNSSSGFGTALMNVGTKAAALIATFYAVKAAVQAVAQAVGVLTSASDSMAGINARMSLMVREGESVSEVNSKIIASAERARMGYEDMSNAVAKLGLTAGDAFNNTDEIIYFTELLNKQFKIAGTSQQEAAAATYQLTQAMAAGVLQGEEFKSIMENAPMLAQSIADAMGVTTGELKNMASEGQITADVVKYALFSTAEETEERFKQIPKSFSDVTTDFKNDIMTGLQPLWDRLSEFANSPQFQATLDTISDIIVNLGTLLIPLLDGITFLIDEIAQLWETWGGPITDVVAAIITLAGSFGLLTGAVNLCKGAIDLCKGAWSALKGIGSTLSAGLGTLSSAFTGAGTAGAAAGAGTTAAFLPVVLVILAIIAVIYLVVAAINYFTGSSISATGIIVGTIAVAIAAIWNVILWVANLVLEIIEKIVQAFQLAGWAIEVAWDWCMVNSYNLIAGIAEWIINTYNSMKHKIISFFADMGIAIAKTFKTIKQGAYAAASGLANMFIGGANLAIKGINWIIDALNEIPGVDLDHVNEIGQIELEADTEGLDKYISDMEALKKQEPEKVTFERKQTKDTEGPDLWEAKKFEYVDLGGVWDEWYNKGAQFEQNVVDGATEAYNTVKKILNGDFGDGEGDGEGGGDNNELDVQEPKKPKPTNKTTPEQNTNASQQATKAQKETGKAVKETNEELENQEDIISDLTDKFKSLRDSIKDAGQSFEAMTYKIVNKSKLLANSNKNLEMTKQYTAAMITLQGNAGLSAQSKQLISELGVEDLGILQALVSMSASELKHWDKNNASIYKLSNAAASSSTVVNMQVEINEASDAEKVATEIYKKLKKQGL